MDTIKIDFIKKTIDGIYTFSDALHLPINHTYTEDDIEAMKQARFDTWLNAILNPPAPIEEAIAAEPVVS